mgnify:CR=1 FL=1
MIKKGDIIKANTGIYSVTNEKVYCVALTDEVMHGGIKVMVIEDNRSAINSNKSIGMVFPVEPRYFDVVDYTDVNVREKDRVLKTAIKLCKRNVIIYGQVNRYMEDKQISVDIVSPSINNRIMYWGYATDDGKKFTILEFNLSYSYTDTRVETLYKYTINCKDIECESYSVRRLVELKRMIDGEDSLMNGVKLYDRVG